MPRFLITTATLAVIVAAATSCADHRSAPLTPPTPATSVPVFGGAQVPDVVEIPTTTPTSTSSSSGTTTTTKARSTN
ncbi:hypothetical protein [Nocardia sp. NBC_00511]|uniref:hypothetical protein n=1 Tax=Nocardia sp. NBC_00511 TaxID=2903591 RepID=UPI0030E1BAD1